jgi:hypothetical protein
MRRTTCAFKPRTVVQLVPILERHGVDLVLSGHEHHYERFAPRGGISYVVSGGGGGRLTKVAPSRDTLARAEVHHYLAVSVEEERLEVRAVDVEGRVFDQFNLKQR